METEIILYGAGGHAKVVLDILQLQEQPVKLLIDDNEQLHELWDFPVYRWQDVAVGVGNSWIVSIGDNAARKKISQKINGRFETALHPKAVIAPTAVIGSGSTVMAGALINPDAHIGEHCIVNTGAIVEHDCRLEDFVHLSPNATLSGNVQVGEGTHIGSGAVILPNLHIGKWAVIGAGAVILHDVPDFAVVVGNPGRVIKGT